MVYSKMRLSEEQEEDEGYSYTSLFHSASFTVVETGWNSFLHVAFLNIFTISSDYTCSLSQYLF